MNEDRRAIIERVASGELSPEEGLALLRGADAGPSSGPEAVSALVISAALGAVTVSGDPGVADAVAVGNHRMHRAGGELRIEGTPSGALIGDGRLLPRVGRRNALRVRVRPDLPVTVKLDAGTVHIEDVRAPVSVEVELGTAALERLVAPFDVRVTSGSVTATATVTTGASTIRCELGHVRVRLDPASDVRITAVTDAGRVILPDGGERGAIAFGTRMESVVGAGAATLDISASAGSVTVKVDR